MLSTEEQDAAERRARRANEEGIGRPYRAAVPPENVVITVGLREGGRIFVVRGTALEVGRASVDEERYIRETYPQVVAMLAAAEGQ